MNFDGSQFRCLLLHSVLLYSLRSRRAPFGFASTTMYISIRRRSRLLCLHSAKARVASARATWR